MENINFFKWKEARLSFLLYEMRHSPSFYCSYAVYPLRKDCHSADSHVFYRVNIAIHLMQLQPILAARWNTMLKQRSSLEEIQALKPWMALWIKNAILNYTWKWSGEWWSLWSAGATAGRRSGAGAGSPTLACRVFCRSALSASVMIGSSCKLSPVQLSQYVPDDEYDADILEEKYISGEKNNYFSKQDNEAEPMLHGHKIEQNFWATALTSNKSPTWRSFCRMSLDVSDPKYFRSYMKLKNYTFHPWFLPKGTDTLFCHSLRISH